MFEQVVRPSQRPNVVPTRRIVSVREVVEVEQAGATWGKAGALPTAIEVPPGEDPAGITIVFKKDKEYNLDYDKSTKQKVKVHNPDDPSQFLVEERLKKAVFTDKKPDSVPVYRVNPDGTTADSDRTKTYSSSGSSVETVTPEPGWHPDNAGSAASDPFRPTSITNHGYGLTFPTSPNEDIISEKGPDG